MRRAPEATPRTRPDERPKKLTRRSASPKGKVFRMMASVSRAGMSSRRADAAPDKIAILHPKHAHTQNYCNYHTRPYCAIFTVETSIETRPLRAAQPDKAHF